MNGSGRRMTPFTTLNTAVFAPIPRASDRIAVKAKPGLRRVARTAWRRVGRALGGWGFGPLADYRGVSRQLELSVGCRCPRLRLIYPPPHSRGSTRDLMPGR